jgi:hypothetical protein
MFAEASKRRHETRAGKKKFGNANTRKAPGAIVGSLRSI